MWKLSLSGLVLYPANSALVWFKVWGMEEERGSIELLVYLLKTNTIIFGRKHQIPEHKPLLCYLICHNF